MLFVYRACQHRPYVIVTNPVRDINGLCHSSNGEVCYGANKSKTNKNHPFIPFHSLKLTAIKDKEKDDCGVLCCEGLLPNYCHHKSFEDCPNFTVVWGLIMSILIVFISSFSFWLMKFYVGMEEDTMNYNDTYEVITM